MVYSFVCGIDSQWLIGYAREQPREAFAYCEEARNTVAFGSGSVPGVCDFLVMVEVLVPSYFVSPFPPSTSEALMGA